MSASRASDEDREQVAEGLRADLLEGRLTVDEYEKRLGQAYRASTVEELKALVADLPDWYVPTGVETRRRPLFGNRSFSVRIESQKPPAVVVAEAMRTIAPHLLRSGYSMERTGESQLVFTRNRRPAWTILAAIFLFPFGLLTLTHQSRESQVFVNAISVHERRTLIDVVGVAPAGVRRALLELER
jgi:hypothetical protein